jgi:REP element-mobilizing transposase RayT
MEPKMQTINHKYMPTPRIHHEQENDLHFLTLTVIEWIDIFTKLEYFQIIIDSLKYCQSNKGLVIGEYVIMTNHMHLIAQAKSGFQLSQIVSDFKKHTTREVLKLLVEDNRKYILNLINNSYAKKKDSCWQIWKRENYSELIYSYKFFLQKANYIHKNPIKRGYVSEPEDWLYSSARNWLKDDNSLIVLKDMYD